MTRFRGLGRSFERLKRQIDAAATAEASHACRECDKRLYADHEACPECGGAVAQLDPDD